eukprot:gene11025-23033_t
MNSVQLSIRGKPSAFDLNKSHDLFIVASPGCITFFDLKGLGTPSDVLTYEDSKKNQNLHGLGTPRHVIHLEQPQQIRKLKYQNLGTSFAALRGGIVSLWDPKNTLKPVRGFVKNTGWISNFDWSTGNQNIMCTACDHGDVRIWDIRTPNTPIQSMNIGSTSNDLSWCPSDSNLFAISRQNTILTYDIRKIGTTSQISSELSNFKSDSVKIDEKIQFHWLNDFSSSFSTSCPIFVAKTNKRKFVWWNIGTNSKEGELELETNYTEEDTIVGFLPTPTGRGIFTYTTAPSDSSNNNTNINTNNNTMDDERLMLDPGVMLGDGGSPQEDLETTLWLQGFGDKEKGIDPTKVAKCPEALLGMRWGQRPGLLVPPSHAGYEGLFLTTSGALHAIKISTDEIRKHCRNDNTVASTSVASIQSGRSFSDGKQDRGTKSSHTTNTSTSTSSTTPRYLISNLRYSLMSSIDHQINSSGMGSNRGITVSTSGSSQHINNNNTLLVKNDNNHLHSRTSAITRDISNTGTSSSSDRYTRQLTIEVIRPTSGPFALVEDTDVNVEEDCEHPFAPGHSFPSSTTTSSTPSTMSLIITAPPSGPPSYSIRGDISQCRATTSDPPLDCRLLVAELTDIARDNLEPVPVTESVDHENQSSNYPYQPSTSTSSTMPLLITLVECFYNRINQNWGMKGTPAHRTLLPLLPHAMTTTSTSNTTTGVTGRGGRTSVTATTRIGSYENTSESAVDNGDSNGNSDGNDLEAIPIEQQAYRVPCPASSGAVFTPSGSILCFGAVHLYLKELKGHNDHDSSDNQGVVVVVDKEEGGTTGVDLAVSSSCIAMEHVSSVITIHTNSNATNNTNTTNNTDTHNNNSNTELRTTRQSSTTTTTTPPVPISYPKTYADMLVRIRDERFATIELNRMNRINSENRFRNNSLYFSRDKDD